VSFGAFDVVVVIDWYIHEVAAVKAERCSLFWFCEDIGPHCFCWAVVVGRLELYRTHVLLYSTMVLLARPTKVRR
jgi:hypothetical protein